MSDPYYAPLNIKADSKTHRLAVCSKCKSILYNSDQYAHTSWHRNLERERLPQVYGGTTVDSDDEV